jgi:Uri superfamily endonuclease
MKGVYILLINVSKGTQERIGSLGKVNFDKGTYAYVGSAQNNLEKRIARHRSKNKKLFWHIDYLLENRFAKVVKAFYKIGGRIEECRIAERLSESEGMVPNFGCSDCMCESHLFKIKSLENVLKLGVEEL